MLSLPAGYILYIAVYSVLNTWRFFSQNSEDTSMNLASAREALALRSQSGYLQERGLEAAGCIHKTTTSTYILEQQLLSLSHLLT